MRGVKNISLSKTTTLKIVQRQFVYEAFLHKGKSFCNMYLKETEDILNKYCYSMSNAKIKWCFLFLLNVKAHQNCGFTRVFNMKRFHTLSRFPLYSALEVFGM